jgi:sarcosine oxidase, subunit delta
MMLIPCPECGPRDEIEFGYGGQAHVPYPQDGGRELTDEQWADYLFVRDNVKGPFAERWVHSGGCRRWFNAIRDTVTYEFLAVYRPNESPPHWPHRPVPGGGDIR